MKNNRQIVLKKVCVNNLKKVSLSLTPNTFIVITGVSGSGKSSLAFDTIFAEGQRRYIESLSHHSRRFLKELPKPDAEAIENLSPTIAIEQKTVNKTPRSTVGTMTGIYDYLRVLYARIGIPHCPISNEVVKTQSKEKIIHSIQNFKTKGIIYFLAPYEKNKKGSFKEDFSYLQQKGYFRVRIDNKFVSLDEVQELDPKKPHDVDIVIDRFDTTEENKNRIIEAVSQSLEEGKGYFSIFFKDTEEEIIFSQYAYSPKSKKSYGPLEPFDFSFNHPKGMCPMCHGLGTVFSYDLDKIIDKEKSISEDCCIIAGHYNTVRYKNIYDNLAKIYEFKVTTPWKDLPKKAKNVFLYGTKNKWTKVYFIHPTKKIRWHEYIQWKGIVEEAKKRLAEAKSDIYKKKMLSYMHQSSCPECLGAKIKSYPAATTVGGKKIFEVTSLSIEDAFSFFSNLQLDELEEKISSELLKEIKKRLQFLLNVGLGYITLDRISPTLSGGESQRVRLAAQIGCGLIGTTYILDEPSIGLHPSDHKHLLHTLRSLQKQGNTVIVVEHDKDTIEEADTIVDVGPFAGKYGGEIIAKGDINEIISKKNSLTGQFLDGKLQLLPPKKPRKKEKYFSITGATHNNLKNIEVKFPLKTFIGVTGVSGSGKSSLIAETLFPMLSNTLMKSNITCGEYKSFFGIDNIDKVIFVDQSPIGRTIRSNPATYIKLLDDIRELFASLPESKLRGYKKGHFSFNVAEGTCPYCKGLGQIKIDMDFMEDTYVECQQCNGKRFDSDILSIEFKGKNISDILDMEVSDAIELFSSIPNIFKKLSVLKDVGLDYLHLGQSATTLSGGEAQRVKLAKELLRPNTKNTFYILDEPTTGLHFYDVIKLVDILQKLVDMGNTVLVIEHNMDFIKAVDWVIDLGPKAGDSGGEIISANTPKKTAKLSTPTGLALKQVFEKQKKHLKKKETFSDTNNIIVEGAKQNNLKSVDLILPHNKSIIFTGPSGSGKSSLAFETIYAEGQRKYIEALPLYVRQFLKMMEKPIVDKIENLSPSIAIEQKGHGVNPRSTVGTMTEIYDLLRIIYSHLAIAYCPETHERIKTISKEYVVNKLLETLDGKKLHILAPIKPPRKEEFKQLIDRLNRLGFLRIRLNKTYYQLDEEIPYDPLIKNELLLVIDRLISEKKSKNRLYEAINTASKMANNIIVVESNDKDYYYNLSFSVESTGKSYPPITPKTFSFNAEQGMCLECQGLGNIYGADISANKEIMEMSLFDIIELLFIDDKGKTTKLFYDYFSKRKIDIYTPLEDLSKDKFEIIANGDKNPVILKNMKMRFKGLNTHLAYMAKHARFNIRYFLLPYMDEKICLECNGARLNPLARNAKLNNISINELSAKNIEDIYHFLKKVVIPEDKKELLEEVFSQILNNLSFLCEIGLGYLSLDRSAPTLSGGEWQRIRLARQLGSKLTSCTYILDEPTIGLHPFNSDLLNQALEKLKNLKNTLLIIEHDPLVIEKADYVIDFGPKAGNKGGKIIAKGTLNEIKNNPKSITGQYLSSKKSIPVPSKRRKANSFLSINNACIHNLKNIDINIPINTMCCITGVSGSGKSTLVHDVIKPIVEKAIKEKKDVFSIEKTKIEGIDAYSQVISLDQSPIGQTSRSDVSTYTQILPLIRSFFSSLKEAKAKGLKPKNFSFNHKRGMCRTCRGMGYKIVDLQYIAPIRVECDACFGYKLNPASLQIKYKGKNFGQILRLTVDEAIEFFASHPKIVKRLKIISSVGLGYLQLGQETATLSGGEAQRIKLSKELAKRTSLPTLYLFDEPTIGLHFDDIAILLPIFFKLIEKNHTIIIIEHNLDIIKSCDYVIDLGPHAGKEGGEIIAKGTPEEIVLNKNSLTAKYLSSYLK